MWIPVDKIIVNKQRLNEEKVEDFVEYIERGRKVKWITVRHYHKPLSGNLYYLIDGHHRLAAYKILGKQMIEAMVTL
jgi:ParB-like chromosome segregation protein Spo0J